MSGKGGAPSQEQMTACGGILKDAATYPRALYHGRQVFFCTEACLHAFEQNPDGFMAGEIEHPVGG